MNLFQKYGIKEVADVVFYSITVVGDEEFYTPVLFLDTLKVSTLEKSAEKVEAKGGKGNKKLITWNFGKEITLNLEDALFSPASMSMIWGGKLNSKLSDYTSAIVKGNLANKYFDSNFSIKAYPSPSLTDGEWDVVFNAAELIKYPSGSDNEFPYLYTYKPDSDEAYILENRTTFIDKYFSRNRIKNEEIVDLPMELFNLPSEAQPGYYYDIEDKNRTKKKVYSISISKDMAKKLMDGIDAAKQNPPESLNISFNCYYYDTIRNVLTGEYEWATTPSEERMIINSFFHLDSDGVNLVITPGGQVKDISENYVELKPLNKDLSAQYRIWQDFVDEDNLNELKTKGENHITVNIKELYEFLENIDFTMQNFIDYPMPAEILQQILSEINSLEKVEYIDTDIHDIEVIDRMEKCIVKERKGLTISTAKQKQNLFKYYADDRTSTYTIYYDAKTMLPLFKIDDGKIDETKDNFTIKMGTIYYKWTRTVKYKKSDDDAILGKTLVIDAETFPDAYKIVGETYIRNQKTGKDQRYQFTIHRANVSTDTSVTLEAEGDPTTFSMQIDVLTPPNDIMMELKQYDVEDDPYEGGTRIVPQKSKYTYTPANITTGEIEIDSNEEIY